ncbi:hypothetical protein V2T44_24125, partial [Serratia ficaria]|nr:hypothetical protein [Serratia ficaria]
MPQELNGHGPTAGDPMGGTGANLNERPDSSKPGGNSQGNGGRDSGNDNSQSAAFQRQMNAVRNDPAIKEMLLGLLKRARAINPTAKVNLLSLDASGALQIDISGMRSDQVDAFGQAMKSASPAMKNVLGMDFKNIENGASV